MSLVNLENNKGNKYLWYKNYFFFFYKSEKDNKYFIQVYESKCREMKYLYDLNIIINDLEKNTFDLNYVKKIIFVPSFIQKSGTFCFLGLRPF